MGFNAESTHAHRIYWPEQSTVSVERNIKFDKMEDYIPFSNMPLEGEDGSDPSDQESVNRPVNSACRPTESIANPKTNDITLTPDPTPTIKPIIPH